MCKTRWLILGNMFLCLGLSSRAHAAAEVALGKVNMSVGLTKATAITATQKFELTTDPVITPDLGPPPVDLSTYLDAGGEFDNTFDPTIFRLAVPADYPNIDNPSTDFSLGSTVMGLTAYDVTSFQVDMVDGGYYTVTAGGSVPYGNVGGGESGTVEDVTFVLDPSRSDEVDPSDMDNVFYQINLIPINATGNEPDFDPGVGTVFAGPGSGLTIGPITNPMNPTEQLTTSYEGPDDNPFVPASSVPEPAAGIACTLGMLAVLTVRRPHRRSV